MSFNTSAYRSKNNTMGLTLLIGLTWFMQMLDGTIVNTALPIMAKHFQVPPLEMDSIVTSYLITLACVMPASAWLSDHMGTKNLFYCALVLFCIGSLLCGLSHTVWEIILSRVIQASGSGLFTPVGRYVVGRTFKRENFIKIMGNITIAAVAGLMVGPLLGGFLAQYYSWRLIFFINIPICLIGMAFNHTYMPDFRSKIRYPFDICGFILWSLGSVLLLMACDVMNKFGIFVLLALSLSGFGFFATYVFYAYNYRNAIFQLSILKISNLRTTLIGNAFTRIGTSSVIYVVIILMQLGYGFSPIKAGIIVTIQAVGMMAVKPFIAKIVNLAGFRLCLAVNSFLIALSMCGISLYGFSPLSFIIGMASLFLFGVFVSTQFTSINSYAIIDVPRARMGMASSILSNTQYLFSSISVAIAFMLYAMLLNGHTAPADYIKNFRYVILALSAITVLASVVFGVLGKRISPPLAEEE